MNIKITHNWLLEYLETDATPEEIREYLSLCGPSIESVTEVKNDFVYDIEIISNRIDYASIRGIAREAAAILPRFGKKAKFIDKKLPDINSSSKELELKIEDKENLCPRKLAVIMEVEIGKSPQIISDRLENCGIRSLNNLIDITNYIMLETGHPTHVFDYDRIKTGEILVRHAKKGETIFTLDGKKYVLDSSDIIFDDGTGRPIDLPGIMGLQNSVVTDTTKRIVFWIETNDPVAIRKTSMRLGIRTVAASINEKKPDTKAAGEAFVRGIALFIKNANGQILSPLYDTNPHDGSIKTLTTDYEFFSKLIGIEIGKDEINQILNDLGFDTEGSNEKILKVKIPSYRSHDIAIRQDLVEEVARVYGYQNIPSALQPVVYVKQPKEMEDFFVFQNKIKLFLKHLGLNEIINYSMVSRSLIEFFGLDPKKHLRLTNSLSEEIEFLRTKISPSLYKNIKDNEGKKEVMRFFEIAKVYLPKTGDLPDEKYKVALAVNTNYLDLKGIIEALYNELNIEIELPDIITEKNGIYMIELDFARLVSSYREIPDYKPINPYSVIKLDKTFTISEKINFAGIKTMASKSNLLQKIEVVTIYENKLTLRFYYSSNKKNITEEEAMIELGKISFKNLKESVKE